ncbi:MAG: glutamate racemase, partial [Raoultibacter sp.]
NYTALASKVYIRPAFQEIAQDYLDPLRRCEIDTLVLGCTHFPLLKTLIGGVVGRDVVLISSAQEVAKDVDSTLSRREQCASPENLPTYQFFTTGTDADEFKGFGSRVLGLSLDSVCAIDLP